MSATTLPCPAWCAGGHDTAVPEPGCFEEHLTKPVVVEDPVGVTRAPFDGSEGSVLCDAIPFEVSALIDEHGNVSEPYFWLFKQTVSVPQAVALAHAILESAAEVTR